MFAILIPISFGILGVALLISLVADADEVFFGGIVLAILTWILGVPIIVDIEDAARDERRDSQCLELGGIPYQELCMKDQKPIPFKNGQFTYSEE